MTAVVPKAVACAVMSTDGEKDVKVACLLKLNFTQYFLTLNSVLKLLSRFWATFILGQKGKITDSFNKGKDVFIC
jgi:hypothetical protein